MIIFDLDGTLADCEHRRHFVDPLKAYVKALAKYDVAVGFERINLHLDGSKWKPDWDAFYEACDKDEPIWPVIKLCNILRRKHHIEIWSGRSMSVQDKTMKWLIKYLPVDKELRYLSLSTRPIGNSEPDEVLKGRWLDEALAEGKTVDYVFDDRPKMVRFWRSRGIFCFDVNQTGEDF